MFDFSYVTVCTNGFDVNKPGATRSVTEIGINNEVNEQNTFEIALLVIISVASQVL